MYEIDQFIRQHPRFELATQFVLADPGRSTTVCFYNFYDQIFRGAETPVDLHLFFFDGEGRQIASFNQSVATGEVAQIHTSKVGVGVSGMVAVAAIPRFDIESLNEGRLPIRSRIGTGFYVIWRDAEGHVDTMLEWLAVRPGVPKKQRHYLVFDNSSRRLKELALILTNPSLPDTGRATARVSVYDQARRVLATEELAELPPMGSRVESLPELFPSFSDWLQSHGALGVEVSGTNLVEPFTFEIHRSGDFHIHHIN